MTDMLRRSLGPMIEIALEFEGGLPAIRTDANQLELARDAMPDGGRLQIAVRCEDVKAGSIPSLNAGEHVCIELTDTGSGMDEATLLRASEPFFTTKELGKGTGLGLSMVYGLAAQSQGALCLASQVGVGTTVELYFPDLASLNDGVSLAGILVGSMAAQLKREPAEMATSIASVPERAASRMETH